MKKRIILTILGLVLVIGVLAGIKGLQLGKMISQGEAFSQPPEVVTAAEVTAQVWESVLSAVGTLEAVEGVTVSAELAGKVKRILFEPGTFVEKGTPLVEQDTSSEEAQLREAEASVALAKTDLGRIRKLLATKAVSQSDFDTTEARLKQAIARSDNIRSVIAKKNIRAPFSGRLGIRQADQGQHLRAGDPIVTLQSLDPIFVNFSLPQQQYVHIKPALVVRITTDALPGTALEGKITTISPMIDSATRNIQLQATVSNTDEQLLPGMFARVGVVLPTQNKVVVIPATAVLNAPYGDSVFVIETQQEAENTAAQKVIRQQFVRLGESRGDYVAVISGLKENQTVVSSGVFKLRNGQTVLVDNKLARISHQDHGSRRRVRVRKHRSGAKSVAIATV